MSNTVINLFFVFIVAGELKLELLLDRKANISLGANLFSYFFLKGVYSELFNS